MTDEENAEFEPETNDFGPELTDQIDAIIESLASLQRSDVMMLNPVRISDMRTALKLIQKSLRSSSDVKVIYKQSDVAPDMGYIDIEGVSMEFKDSTAFAKIASLASNTEVYPLAKNKVRLTFTFNHLMLPLD